MYAHDIDVPAKSRIYDLVWPFKNIWRGVPIAYITYLYGCALFTSLSFLSSTSIFFHTEYTSHIHSHAEVAEQYTASCTQHRRACQILYAVVRPLKSIWCRMPIAILQQYNGIQPQQQQQVDYYHRKQQNIYFGDPLSCCERREHLVPIHEIRARAKLMYFELMNDTRYVYMYVGR